jgi:hypothetical protein
VNLTIRFPDAIDVPAEIPVLTVRTSRWTGPEISRLARSMDVVGKPVDVGLWQVARDERAALEIYQASQSFRFTRVDLDPEGRDGLDPTVTPDQAWSVAEGWIEAFGPDGIRREVHSVTEHEVLIAVRDAGEPRSAIVGLDVNYRFSLDGWALLGPGAKAKVSVHPTGVVGGA